MRLGNLFLLLACTMLLIGCRNRHRHNCQPINWQCTPIYKETTSEWGTTEKALEKVECKQIPRN